jgi:hypothetical protein
VNLEALEKFEDYRAGDISGDDSLSDYESSRLEALDGGNVHLGMLHNLQGIYINNFSTMRLNADGSIVQASNTVINHAGLSAFHFVGDENGQSIAANRTLVISDNSSFASETPLFNEGLFRLGSQTHFDISGSVEIGDRGQVITSDTSTLAVSGDWSGTTTVGTQLGGVLLLNGSGTTGAPQTFEVMSSDQGNEIAGFGSPFLVGTLELAENSHVVLVDESDNSTGLEDESLYINNLVVPSGATLDLNGFNVYTRGSVLQGQVINGTVQQIADSGTDTESPFVLSDLVQNGLTQRSFVDRLRIDFNEQVNVGDFITNGNISDAITLNNLGVNVDVDADQSVSLSADQFRYVYDEAQGISRLTWSFDNFAGTSGSLDDGLYQFVIDANLVTDIAGNPFDGNSDGLGNDDYALSFHRLAGDANGDGVVGPSDMMAVLDALGSTPESTKWNENMDLDRDGRITIRDRVLVARALNNRIVPSASSPAPKDPLSTFDVSSDGELTPRDALLVINQLARTDSRVESEIGGASLAEAPSRHDVNRDGNVSPLDALLVINQVARMSKFDNGAEAEDTLPDELFDASKAEFPIVLQEEEWFGHLEDDDEPSLDETIEMLAYGAPPVTSFYGTD